MDEWMSECMHEWMNHESMNTWKHHREYIVISDNFPAKQNMTSPHPAKLIYLNFHLLEVVSRYRDAQQAVEITHICLISA